MLAFPVHDASLTQRGQEIVWEVKLDHGFSPAGLEHDGRSLCLVLSSGKLCVKSPARGRHSPRLLWAGQAIDASVTRSSDEELTATFLPSSVGLGYGRVRWQVVSGAGTSTSVFPARPALARLHTPQPVGCVPSGAPFVYHGPSDRRVVALTFDDGPWPDTPQFLDVLEREHVHATFFQIGRQVATYGRGVDERMLADGDMIGDHTWSHPDVAGAGSFAAGQISDTAGAIRRLTGFTPCLFRAPGGSVSGALIAEARGMGFTTVQWDIDPRDWARPGTGAIYSNVIANAHNGAIVIQHDGGGDRSETLAALPHEIDTLRSEGYQFVTITELLGQEILYR
jgi:peptidoglycan/xylan/chitin deacetylase (PgdA/CDA1 family)